MHENEISEKIIGAAIEVHRILGPGLLNKPNLEFQISSFKLQIYNNPLLPMRNGGQVCDLCVKY